VAALKTWRLALRSLSCSHVNTVFSNNCRARWFWAKEKQRVVGSLLNLARITLLGMAQRYIITISSL
jgi:hypothetical protein